MSTVSYALDRGIATITLDSPSNRNALSAVLVRELHTALELACLDAAVRAIVLTHTGTTFCAGNDLREAGAEGGARRSTERLVELLRAIVEAPKPVLAQVDGHVRAGGVGLVGACDIALAGPAATFAFSEVRIGVAPAIISLTTRTRLTERASGRYYLTGEVFDGATAAQIGLITEFAPSVAELDIAIERVLSSLRLAAPLALAETKRLTTAGIRAAFVADADALQKLSARLFASEHGREGMQAFLDKRPANWVLPD